MTLQQKFKNAEKLIKDIDKKIRNWDERSQFKIKGVSNLSRADLDQMKLYAEFFIRNGGSFSGLMKPMGSLKEVLDAYGITEEFSYDW